MVKIRLLLETVWEVRLKRMRFGMGMRKMLSNKFSNKRPKID